MSEIRIAPPDKAAEILKDKGYPVSAKLLRQLHRDGRLAAVWTGYRLLISIEKAVELFENGEVQKQQSGQIRRIS